MSIRDNNFTTTSCADSILTVSCGSVGDGNEDISLAPQVNGLDKLLSELKCKRAFQDEASQNGQAAAVYSSPGVSQLVGLICGPEKRDLKAETRQSLKELEELCKELIKSTNIHDGNIVKEAINELFHNPDHIVFRNLLTKEPADWTKVILPVILHTLRNEALKEELQKDIREIQKKRRELAKDIGLEKKRLAELKANRKEKMDKIDADNIRRMTISTEADKLEIERIEAIQSECGAVITNDEVEDLVTRFHELKSRRDKVYAELQAISAEGALPPDIQEATLVLENKKSHLEALIWQQSNPLEVSSNPMDSSVFQKYGYS